MEQFNPIEQLSQIKKVEVPNGLLEKIHKRARAYSSENFSKRISYAIAASITLFLCVNVGVHVFGGTSTAKMAFYSQVNSNNELYK
jgi:hypothetical protein